MFSRQAHRGTAPPHDIPPAGSTWPPQPAAPAGFRPIDSACDRCARWAAAPQTTSAQLMEAESSDHVRRSGL